jgi:hypothetical protein
LYFFTAAFGIVLVELLADLHPTKARHLLDLVLFDQDFAHRSIGDEVYKRAKELLKKSQANKQYSWMKPVVRILSDVAAACLANASKRQSPAQVQEQLEKAYQIVEQNTSGAPSSSARRRNSSLTDEIIDSTDEMAAKMFKRVAKPPALRVSMPNFLRQVSGKASSPRNELPAAQPVPVPTPVLEPVPAAASPVLSTASTDINVVPCCSSLPPAPRDDPTAVREERPLYVLLASHGVEEYYDAFIADGWETVDDVSRMSEEELVADIGLKKGHARRLKMKMATTNPDEGELATTGHATSA